jgi:glucokinase
MEFIDLKAQSLLLSSSIQNRIKTVLEHSRFITKFKNKSGFIGELKSKGIPTMIDYPHPLHT